MAIHSRNEALMCKVFASNFRPVATLSRFMTCSKVPWPLDSLLSMTMQEGETLKTYSNRYWEMFNEIDGNFDDVAIRTFKVDLLAEHDLRKSLIRKPVKSVRQLVDYIDEYN